MTAESVVVVDASALVCLLVGEPEAPLVVRALAAFDRRLLPATSLVEAGIAMQRLAGPMGRVALDSALVQFEIEVVDVDEAGAKAALEAWVRFGKLSGHEARLNFGDCFSYAVARQTSAALLYVGDDFGHTDVETAISAAT